MSFGTFQHVSITFILLNACLHACVRKPVSQQPFMLEKKQFNGSEFYFSELTCKALVLLDTEITFFAVNSHDELMFIG